MANSLNKNWNAHIQILNQLALAWVNKSKVQTFILYLYDETQTEKKDSVGMFKQPEINIFDLFH